MKKYLVLNTWSRRFKFAYTVAFMFIGLLTYVSVKAPESRVIYQSETVVESELAATKKQISESPEWKRKVDAALTLEASKQLESKYAKVAEETRAVASSF